MTENPFVTSTVESEVGCGVTFVTYTDDLELFVLVLIRLGFLRLPPFLLLKLDEFLAREEEALNELEKVALCPEVGLVVGITVRSSGIFETLCFF